MKSLILVLTLLWSWGLWANPKRVIVISMDGAAPWVIAKTKLPILEKIASKGSSSWTAQTIYPSITLPSHTSMVTSVGPEVHGVLWNDYYPEKGVVQVPTMFGAAKAAGLKTAIVCSKPKFKHLQVPGTLDWFYLVNSDAKRVADKAIEVLQQEKPQLTLIHFKDPDAAGHAFGWGSTQQKMALQLVDQQLGRILSALEAAGMMADTTLIISADHGGHDRTHGTRKKEDMTIPWIAYGYGANQGPIKAEISTIDTAATSLWLLGINPPSSFQGKPVTGAFSF